MLLFFFFFLELFLRVYLSQAKGSVRKQDLKCSGFIRNDLSPPSCLALPSASSSPPPLLEPARSPLGPKTPVHVSIGELGRGGVRRGGRVPCGGWAPCEVGAGSAPERETILELSTPSG